jgi:DNA-binding beta-propeller fold protein YncE
VLNTRTMRLALCMVFGVLVLASTPALAKEVHVYSSSFGAQGSGPGQFQEPSGVAVNDASGDVYVVDKGNHRIEELNSTGTTLLAEFGGGVLVSPEAISIDNSGNALDPSKEDVYVTDTSNNVIDKFTPSGTYVGQIAGGAQGSPFGSLLGIAVDATGMLWVDQDRSEKVAEIDAFSDEEQNQLGSSREWMASDDVYGARGFAIDSEDDLYVFHGFAGNEPPLLYVAKLTNALEVLRPPGEELGGTSDNTGIAVDPSDNSVYLDKGTSVEKFTATGSPVDTFGAGHLTGGVGLAVDPSNGTVYVADSAGDDVAVFTTVVVPDVATGEATGIQSEGSATLNGTVDPDGIPVTSCAFEYVAESAYQAATEAEAPNPYEGGGTVPCSSNPGGTAPVAVSASLAGLIVPGTFYHYRLVAANSNGQEHGEDRAFTAAAHPVISGTVVSSSGATEAKVSAQINPGGLLTTYHLEYGTTTAYGSDTPEAGIGAGLEASGIQVRLKGLSPGTAYHARLVASNEVGEAASGDLTFTTAGATGPSVSALPDGRAYELVSAANPTDVYEPDIGGGEATVLTSRPFRAAADGDAIAYLAEPLASGGSGSQGLGDEFLARRTSMGWQAADITPQGASLNTQYASFSSDLSIGILQMAHLSNPETADAAACDPYAFRTEDGRLHVFFTGQRLVTSCEEQINDVEPSFAGASADHSHILFETQAALTEGAEQATGQLKYNLYDSVNGRLQLVNVLPGPTAEPDPNATFGGPHDGVGKYSNPAGFSNVISADGSRIFWTDRNTDDLYMRLDGTSTVPISTGDARYWTATPDGKYVYYTEGEESASRLWRFDVDRYLESGKSEVEALAETREALTGEGSGVDGVVGINETGEDGAYTYFVAEGSLASNENQHGERASPGSPNLYVLSGGAIRFIATLSYEDNELKGPLENNSIEIGDWQHNPGDRTAEVTPDGHAVSFLSHATLTRYDTNDVPEAYVYDSQTDQLSCASCSPDGLPPLDEAVVPTTDTGGNGGSTYMARWLSADGSRVFFDTREALVPQDTDGKWNVYEWERDGAGSCQQSAGCVYLLSGGSSPENSLMTDASANGSDVFFTSREDFTPQAGGEDIKLYDARVDGGFPESFQACTGTGCQGVPPAPPIFATPSSATFNGVGNFETPSAGKRVTSKKKRTTAQLQAEKLSKALKACKRKPKRKRALCERQAKKRHSPAKRKGK